MRSLKFSGKPKKPKFTFGAPRPLMLRRVSGESMLPALRPGKIVLATSWVRRVEAGHVVIVRHAGVEKIKRLQRRKDGHVFVVGDNSEASTDSRHFGWLPQEVVIAKILWPRYNKAK